MIVCYLKWFQRFFAIYLSLILSGCYDNLEELANKRIAFAKTNPEEVKIFAIKPMFGEHYLEGVQLAINQVNSEKILGDRKLVLSTIPQKFTFEEMKPDIMRAVRDPEAIAVLGHLYSSVAVPASVIYDQAKILSFPSYATSSQLGSLVNFDYIFKMQPDVEQQAAQILSFTDMINVKKVALYYSRDSYDVELGVRLLGLEGEFDSDIVMAESFFKKDADFISIVTQLKKSDVDAVILSAGVDSSVKLINRARREGIDIPIILTDSADKEYLSDMIGLQNKIIVPITYSITNKNPVNRKFVSEYQSAFGVPPNRKAAIGYDSVMLLSEAIIQAGTTDPSALSTILQNMKAWHGSSGSYKFGTYNRLFGKKFHFEVLKDGAWHEMPYSKSLYVYSLLKKTVRQQVGVDDDIFAYEVTKANDDYNYFLLNLSYYIARYKNLGVTYIDDDEGRKAVNYKAIKRMASSNEVNISECRVSPLLRNKSDLLNDAVLSCYISFDSTIDAVYGSLGQVVSEETYEKIGLSLNERNIISFQIGGYDSNERLLFSLTRNDIGYSDVELDEILPLFYSKEGMYDLYSKIKNVPMLFLDESRAQSFNLDESIMLDLAPIRFLEGKSDG